MSRPCSHPGPRARVPAARHRGFTLVELLIVIVVIGILMALLLPALAGAIRAANDGRVSAEISNFATALGEFKNRYGTEPPSRIMLSEAGWYPVSNTSTLASFNLWTQRDSSGAFTTGALPAEKFGVPDITVGQLADRSLQALRKCFPKAVFSTTGAIYPVASPQGPMWHDFNGDGVLTPGFILLEGHECLTFFLGGIPSQDLPNGLQTGVSGFAQDIRNPFMGTLLTAPTQMRSDNRVAPSNFTFAADRLIDEDGDSMPGYIDPLGRDNIRFYAYFSSYGGESYDPNDVNFGEVDDTNTLIARPYITSRFAFFGSPTISAAPNPYTSNVPGPPGNTTARATFINAGSYQIISAGSDGFYGPGGQFTQNSQGDRLPNDGASTAWRTRERDNLSNFANGRFD